jgi:hypothetical protein
MNSEETGRKENELETKIEKSYAYHKPSDTTLLKIRELRKAFSNIDKLVKEVCPASRERAVSITQLETAAMWAIKAVVINDPTSLAESN